jgi:Flp pilus assembly protein TadD
MPRICRRSRKAGRSWTHRGCASAYREAATRDPKDVEVQAGIGWALWKSGNCEDAEGPLRNAIKLDPNYADSYDILGTVLRDAPLELGGQ